MNKNRKLVEDIFFDKEGALRYYCLRYRKLTV